MTGYSYEIRCSYRETFNGTRDAAFQNEMRLELMEAERWYVVADPDEFHFHTALRTFGELATAAEKEPADFVPSVLVDRLRQDGRITALDQTLSLDQQFPMMCPLTGSILLGSTAKVALARCSVPIQAGHHYAAAAKPASFQCQTHHFKWQGKEFLKRLRDRELAFRVQGLPYGDELGRLLKYVQDRGGMEFKNSALPVQLADRIGI